MEKKIDKIVGISTVIALSVLSAYIVVGTILVKMGLATFS